MNDEESCFARINKKRCNALNKKDCKNCKFYSDRSKIVNNPFYPYSYKDLKRFERDKKRYNIKDEDVVW